MKHNAAVEQKRAEAVVNAGWYRPSLWNNRIKPKITDLRYGQPIKVNGYRAGTLFDQRGREHLLKTVLPVKR